MLICKKPKIYDVDLYGIGLIGALAIAAWLFIFQPLDLKIMRIQQEKKQKQQTSESAEKEFARLRLAVAEQRRLTDRFMRNAEMIDRSRDLFDVIGIMGSLAEKTSLRLDRVVPGDAEFGDRYYKTPLEVKVYGTYPGIYRYLSQMDRELPFVKVKSVSLQKDTPDSPACSIALNCDVYTAL